MVSNIVGANTGEAGATCTVRHGIVHCLELAIATIGGIKARAVVA